MSQRLCTLAELAESGSRSFEVGEGDWPLKGFVVSCADGEVRGFVNSCPHAGHPLDLLSHRFLSGDRQYIQCASHGALFERDSGLCVAGPCTGRRLRPLPVRVIAGEVRLAPDTAGVDNAPPPRGARP